MSAPSSPANERTNERTNSRTHERTCAVYRYVTGKGPSIAYYSSEASLIKLPPPTEGGETETEGGGKEERKQKKKERRKREREREREQFGSSQAYIVDAGKFIGELEIVKYSDGGFRLFSRRRGELG